jgi:hypothetical protein
MKNNKTMVFTMYIFQMKNRGFEGIQGLQVTLGTDVL